MVLLLILLFNYAFTYKLTKLLFLIKYEKPSIKFQVIHDIWIRSIDIDLSRNFSWTSNSPYIDLKGCTSFGKVPVSSFDQEIVEIHQCKSDCLLGEGNVKLTNFSFMVATGETKKIPTYSIGLARNFTNPQLSLVHHLLSSNKITKMRFGFILDGLTGAIFFGDLPSISTVKKNSFCDCDKDIIGWGCQVKFIDLNYYRFENRYKMTFNTNLKDITVPNEFFEFLKEKIFQKNPFKRNCAFQYNGNEKNYVCHRTIEKDAKKIKFSIGLGEYVYQMNFFDFFDCFHSTCKCYLKHDKRMSNEWVFGTIFIMKFDSLFDMEESKVHFYSDNINFIEIEKYQRPNKNSLFILELVILGFGLACVLYTKIKTRQK